MGYMKVKGNIGQTLDVTRGAREALKNITSIAALAEQANQQEVQNARQAKADARTDLLFNQQQEELQRQRKNRDIANNIVAEWDPHQANDDGLQVADKRILERFSPDKLSLAEQKVQQLGLSAERPEDQSKIGKIYNEILYGTNNQNTINKANAAMQSIYDNNEMSKEYAKRRLLREAVNKGADVTAVAGAIDSAVAPLKTRAEINAEAAAKAKAVNDALKDQVNNNIKIEGLKLRALKGGSKSGSSKNNTKWYPKVDVLKGEDLIRKADRGSLDTEEAMSAYHTLVELHGVPPGAAAAFVLAHPDEGLFATDNREEVDSFDPENKALRDTLYKAYTAFAKGMEKAQTSATNSNSLAAATLAKDIKSGALTLSRVKAKTWQEMKDEYANKGMDKVDAILARASKGKKATAKVPKEVKKQVAQEIKKEVEKSSVKPTIKNKDNVSSFKDEIDTLKSYLNLKSTIIEPKLEDYANRREYLRARTDFLNKKRQLNKLENTIKNIKKTPEKSVLSIDKDKVRQLQMQIARPETSLEEKQRLAKELRNYLKNIRKQEELHRLITLVDSSAK